jgi:2',3'-cyclic-nucleotide 2'-phosphodiesterase (5'-nucleotidase family)/predicted AlkP superfamily phosphohydrolase/phosphomutase
MSMRLATHRSWIILLVAVLLFTMIEPLATAQDATPAGSPQAEVHTPPVVLFASDGMRPDFVTRYSAAGLMPNMADLAANGVVGDNGLLQAFPPNTGTGWASLATGTWPGVHGSVNNTFYRTGDADFNNRTSAFDSGVLQAQTIAQAAEQYGKDVVVVGWTGTAGLVPQLNGPAIDYWSTYAYGSVLANYDLGTDASYQRVDLTTAIGWKNVPESYSPALEQVFTITSAAPDINPDRSFHLYIYDSTDDDTTTYDRVLLVPATAPAAVETASPVASPEAEVPGRDGSLAVADLAVGDWQDVKVTLTGEMEGLTAGFYLKLVNLNDDASEFRLYATGTARADATYHECDYAPGCAQPSGFAETIAADYPSATGSDYFPLQNGLIDEATYVEQGLLNIEASQAYLTFILDELGLQPDLLMVGAPVTDEFTHQFLGLVTASGPGGMTNPRYDDADNDGMADGLVETREGYIAESYAATDALLGTATSLLADAPNVLVSSDHGFAPQWLSVNAPFILQQAGLTTIEASGNCAMPDDVDPATVMAKACATGASANIYVNLTGRDIPGAVAEEDYDAVRQQIVEAFTSFTDPENPDYPVVAEVLLREEVGQEFGPTAVHPSRTGDVVVILNPPYQFDSATPGQAISPSVFFGQHGYLPDLVDLDANINLHGTFLAAGPAFVGGATIDGVEAIDVAPTAAFLLGIPGPTSAAGSILYDALANGDDLREISLVSISDYHAQFAPLSASPDSFADEAAPGVSAPIAGAAHLLPWIDYFRGEARDGELFLTASDIIGATPPLSAFFDDMPAIEMMNAFGLDAAAVGNHHFDINYQWFIDLMAGAQYPSLAANVVLAEGTPIALPVDGATPIAETGAPWAPTAVFEFDGVTVGVIGITTLDTYRVTRVGALGPYEILDPVPVINEYAAQLREQGADIIVVLAHEGATAGTLSDPTGPIVDITDQSVGVTTVMGDHSSMQVISLRPNGTLLTQNPGRGETLTRTRVVVDATTGEVVYSTADYHLPWNIAVAPDPAVTARIDELTADIQPILGEQVGVAAAPILRSDNCGGETGRLCESLIGNVITDAMRISYGADFAITNSGGIRADLTCPTEPTADDFCADDLAPNAITRGQVLGVLPFGNVAVTVDLNGAELKALLEAGLVDSPAEFGGFQQVSGLCLTYSVDLPAGERITSAVRQAEDGSCTGEAIDFSETATYTIISNDFSMSGGDGYPDFSDRMVTLDILDELVARYLLDVASAGTPIAPEIQGRITCEGTTCPTPIATDET